MWQYGGYIMAKDVKFHFSLKFELHLQNLNLDWGFSSCCFVLKIARFPVPYRKFCISPSIFCLPKGISHQGRL